MINDNVNNIRDEECTRLKMKMNALREEAFVPRNYWEWKIPQIFGIKFRKPIKLGNFNGMGLRKFHIFGNLVEKASASFGQKNAKVSSSKV